MNRGILVVFIAGVLAFTLACNKGTNDDAITTNIKAALYSDQITKPANIEVAVKGGQVTLSGDVPSADVALQAMKIANGTPGVKGVSDQMTINGTSAANQLPPDAGNPGAAPATGGSNTAQNGPAPVPRGTAPSDGAPPANPYSSQQPAPPTSSGQVPPPPAGPPQPVTLIVPPGERVTVRTTQAINSKTAHTGELFRATVAEPVRVHGEIAIPRGAEATLDIAEDQNAGEVAGRPVLELRLVHIAYKGHQYAVRSSLFEETGKSRGRQTAVRTGFGAAAGAIIGAIAGGGKGAAIGTAAGGGAGFGSDFFTKGPTVHIPAETLIAFRVEAPIRVER